MNAEELNKLRQTMPMILAAMRKSFDMAFSVDIREVNGELRIQFRQQDSGAEYMTLNDVSALLQMDRRANSRHDRGSGATISVARIPFALYKNREEPTIQAKRDYRVDGA